MPDQEAPISVIQNSFLGGEITPDLYGRTDLAKVHQGAALCKNFFVDFKGGAKSRPGTQFIGNPGSSGFARVYPFVFSQTVGQTYMLLFSDSTLRFIKNPGTAAYPNSSNSGFIMSGGVPYQISTPYVAADLPFLKFSQVNDILRITNHNYARMQLQRFSDTNWTLTAIVPASAGLAAPASPTTTVSGLPPGSGDPQNTIYRYALTSVDSNGIEGSPSFALAGPGIDITTTQGTVSIFWTPIAGAAYYKVYKALSTPGNKLPPQTGEFGFAGFSSGNSFVDSNIVPDFTQQPIVVDTPFAVSQISGFHGLTAGSGYHNEGTFPMTITDSTGTGALIYPVMGDNTSGGTSGITGLWIANPGSGYTAPTVAPGAGAGGTGFSVTLDLSPATGVNPDVCGVFQQRSIYASTANFPNRIFASRSGTLEDNRVHNPVQDNDAFEFDIFNQQVVDILWMLSMPGGLVLGTNAGIVQLTGGAASPANPLAVTPSNAVIVPQSDWGTADLPPIKINYDIIFVQSEGSLVRDLQYNFFVNIYLGEDISFYSSHLFYPLTITSWAYQDIPNKVIWAVRSDGVLLSCTYLKEQQVVAWAQHNTTGGLFESVAVVREGAEDAVYFSINRNGTRSVERLCDRIFTNGVSDAWCLDAALSTPLGSGPVTSISGLDNLDGQTVSALIDGVPYANLGPVIGGSLTLPVAGSKVVVGLPYTCDLQPLYLDIPGGAETLQGRRKKIAAWSARVKDSAGFKMGTTVADLRPWTQGVSSTDPPIYQSTPGLLTGDARMITNMWFNVGGQFFIRQDQPLPLQVLSFEPEWAQGDTR